ncbi:MAG: alpha/beta hydrolase fold domain-containing protein, partial [Granulosicoccus sp.]
TDFSCLPPTVVFSAECDPLNDDGQQYCDFLQQAGGSAHWINEQGLVHGYLRARHSVQRATKSFDRIVHAIDSLAARRWPY